MPQFDMFDVSLKDFGTALENKGTEKILNFCPKTTQQHKLHQIFHLLPWNTASCVARRL